MNTQHSNIKVRRNTIIKAIIMLGIVMLFSAFATSLITEVNQVEEKELKSLKLEKATLEQSREVLDNKIDQIKKLWNSYINSQQEFIQRQDSADISQIQTIMEKKENQLKTAIHQLSIGIKDTSVLQYALKYQTIMNLLTNTSSKGIADKITISTLNGEGEQGLINQQKTRIEDLEDKIYQLKIENSAISGEASNCNHLERDIETINREKNRFEDKLGNCKKEQEKGIKKLAELKMSYRALISDFVSKLNELGIKGMNKKEQLKDQKEGLIKYIKKEQAAIEKP